MSVSVRVTSVSWLFNMLVSFSFSDFIFFEDVLSTYYLFKLRMQVSGDICGSFHVWILHSSVCMLVPSWNFKNKIYKLHKSLFVNSYITSQLTTQLTICCAIVNYIIIQKTMYNMVNFISWNCELNRVRM